MQYALRKLRDDEAGYRKTHIVEGGERPRVWRGITYTRHFEACIAEVAAELSKTSGFDHEEGNETLKHLSPLYHPGNPPDKFDAVAIRTSMNKVKMDREELFLSQLLDKIWARGIKTLRIDGKQPDDGWCLVQLGYASGARIFFENGDKLIGADLGVGKQARKVWLSPSTNASPDIWMKLQLRIDRHIDNGAPDLRNISVTNSALASSRSP